MFLICLPASAQGNVLHALTVTGTVLPSFHCNNNRNTSHPVTCPDNISNWIILAAFPRWSFACKQSWFPVLYSNRRMHVLEKSVTLFALRVACLGKQEWGLTPVQLISATALLSRSPVGSRSEILCHACEAPALRSFTAEVWNDLPYISLMPCCFRWGQTQRPTLNILSHSLSWSPFIKLCGISEWSLY